MKKLSDIINKRKLIKLQSMMETNDNEQYLTFPLDNVHEGIQNNISHEEICEPIDDCILPESLTEVTVDEVNQDIAETRVAVEIITENSEGEEEQSSIVYPIYIKKEISKQFNTGDESMAVEALRQLGGMYPCTEDKKVTCSNCSNMFLQMELAKHQTSCMSKKHTCNTCGEKFERKIDLNNHMVCHQVDRPHACRTCGNLFRSKINLQNHMTEVHQVERPHKCSVCGADFQRPSSLSNHMKIHSYVAGRALIQAQTSNVTDNTENFRNVFSTQETAVLATTIQNLEIPQVQWAVQTYNFSTDQNNIDGLVHQNDKIDSLQEFTVLPNGEVAQFEFNPQSAEGHQYSLTLNSFNNSTSNTLVKVEAANFSNENKKAYIEIDLQENSMHTCSQCGVSFARAASLSLHEKTHKKNEWISPVECEYCDKQFQDANFLASHQKSCTKKIIKNSREPNAPNVKWGKHACSECGKKFTTKQKMFRHQWIHRKKTHSCEVCGIQFEKQLELDEHRLSAHPGDSQFTCSECGKSFVSRQGLWEHGRTHAGSPAYFHCDTCSKTFSSRQGYLIHHRTHTGERPYGCKFCWKAFRDGGTLRKHERIHTGERPHVCPLCSRAFNQKVVLREHVRWVHAAGKNETECTGPPFSCPLCGSLTQDRDELCAHIVKHSDQMIAEAKAKTTNEVAKAKQQKKRNKTSEKKRKISQPKGVRIISASEQNEALLSITEQVDSSPEIQDTYFVVKNEYNDALCIKTYTRPNNTSEIDRQNESINVITIAKPSDIKDESEAIDIVNRQSNVNTMHLIPITTSGETVHLISSNKPNTLHLISKQNENLPVLTLPNPQTNNFSNQIQEESNNLESSPNILTQHNQCTESVLAETMIVQSVSMKIVNEHTKTVINKEESDDESEELVCGICGNDFDDKNILMEHVKIHL